MRSIAVARMQPLVVAPQSTTVSMRCDTRIDARFVPKNAEAPFLRMTVSSGRGAEARVDLLRAVADLQLRERRELLHPQAAVLGDAASKAIVVKITGMPPARATSSESPRRLDLAP